MRTATGAKWNLSCDHAMLNAHSLVADYFPPERRGRVLGFTSAGGSMGVLCLGSPMIRFSSNVLNTGGAGTVDFSPNLNNLPQGTVFAPGDTWNLQFWYRDVVLNPTSNTTDGISITFQ
jgi:hypothetical protein